MKDTRKEILLLSVIISALLILLINKIYKLCSIGNYELFHPAFV